MTTRPSESKAILAAYLAEPDTARGIRAVMQKFGLPYLRAIHETNKALNEMNAGIDFSKYREQLPP